MTEQAIYEALEELERYRSLGISIEELEEYSQAKKGYRSVVFPVAIGQTVWIIDEGRTKPVKVSQFTSKVIGNWKIKLRSSFCHNWLMQDLVETYTVDLKMLGRTWFLTEDDALNYKEKNHDPKEI